MAVFAAAQLLDELMGRNRNVLPHEKVKELNWEDSEYCKFFLVKFCPHDLFVNTKADLGTCSKVHDEEVRKMFTKARGHRKLQYQEDFLRCCTQMMNDVERKIQKGRQRLALNSSKDATPANPAQVQRNEEQLGILNERINGLEQEAEESGNNGNVEQAQGLMKLCDQLKDERDLLKKMSEAGHRSSAAEIAAAQEKVMEVCEVCGAFLIVGDAQQRIDDHLMGKQHMGYARLKAAIEEVANVVQATRDERKAKSDERKEKELEKDKDDSRKSGSKERERSHHREPRERSEYRMDKDRNSIDKRDKDKDKRNSERRDSGDYNNRDRSDREQLQRERDQDRRHHSSAREHRSHHRHDRHHHSSSHRRH